jgi:surface antigen
MLGQGRRRRFVACAAAVCLTTFVGFGVERALPADASSGAAAYGYPYPNAPDCDELTGANCVPDQWGFVQGQCHSWVAYRLNELNAAELQGTFNDTYLQPSGQEWGDAWHWGTAAGAAGFAVDDQPALGSVAWWSADGGHVAYVEGLNDDGSVTISEMNADLHNGFDFATLRRGVRWPDGFIHVADLPSTTTSSTTAPTTTTVTTATTTTTSTNTTSTTETTATTATSLPQPSSPPTVASGAKPVSGYWLLSNSGTVYPFGASRGFGNGASDSVAIGARRDGRGYWTVDANGTVSAHGASRVVGARPSLRAGEMVRAISVTASGNGYWLYSSGGRVFPAGDASGRLGDLHALHLNASIVGAAATASGRGYYMVGADGGVFAFGDARFFGSTATLHLVRPIVGLVPTTDGRGYWLVAADGGVFAFGDAAFRGSMGSRWLAQPVIGIVRYGNGYLMVASDGGVFDFSNRPFAGSLGRRPPTSPVVALAAFG